MHIPALNEIVRSTLGKEPKYPENPEDLQYMILFPEDYQNFGIDPEGNLAVLLDKENAEEVKRLAEKCIERIEEDGS